MVTVHTAAAAAAAADLLSTHSTINSKIALLAGLTGGNRGTYRRQGSYDTWYTTTPPINEEATNSKLAQLYSSNIHTSYIYSSLRLRSLILLMNTPPERLLGGVSTCRRNNCGSPSPIKLTQLTYFSILQKKMIVR